jgi:peptidyl-prolyl cis-trans isomerase D
MAKGNNISKTAVWVLMGLLILGLGGFGATNLSGTLRTIGSVGEKPLAIDIYARMLQQEIRSFEAQTGNTLTFQQVQAMGLDQAVLNRFIQTRALDHEAAQMGLSVGDETLRSRILEVRAFQGINGSFDRDTYRFALQQAGVTETQFETQLREEVARTLLQGAIASGVEMPASYADTLVEYIAQERSFTWTKLDASHLAAPLAEPTQDDLQGHYDAHIADFTLPQTKRITYAWLSPEMIAQQITVADSEVQAAYDARAVDYNQPERRLVERLVYLDDPSANQARAALDSGTDFDTLVSDRGLTLADVDLGDLTREDLGTAADAVFAAEVGQIVGPLPSDLGPALFRVNAVLPAQITALDDVRGDLTRELAMDAAARQIDARAEGLNDLMAAGATLEELASETDMQIGAIDWTQGTQDGIAAYESFRLAAQALSAEDFPEILLLEDGGVFAMRLDETLPPRPAPFETVGADVAQQWRNAQTVTALTQQLQPLIPQLSSGTSFAEAGFDAVVEENLTRNSFVAGTPQGFLQGIFSLQPGEVSVLGGVDGVFVARLDQIHAPAQNSEAQALAAQVEGQINQALAQDLFEIYASDVIQRAGPSIDPRAVQAVHANFP